MATVVKKKRSEEARRRRNQKKHRRAQESDPRKPYLLPRPHVPGNHEYDCVAIDCEILIDHAYREEDRIALASVGIVDRDGNCIYERFVPPPSDRRINLQFRRFFPVQDQQFLYARRDPASKFSVIRAEVLDILRRYVD